jgi:hypothetical protein
VTDPTADLKALANRLTKAANAPAVTDQMRADLNDAADIVWEYMVLIEPDDATQNASAPSAFSGSFQRQSRSGRRGPALVLRRMKVRYRRPFSCKRFFGKQSR